MDQLAALLQQQASAVQQPAGVSVPDAAEAHIQAARLAAANKTQERQQQANRLATAYREETKVLMKELLKQQIGWREDLQASGVHVGVPVFQPPRGLTVRKRLSWRTAEREALKRLLFAHGVGKWKEIHTCLCGLIPAFKHGAGDVEDACWQLLGELQLLVASHDEHMYLARLMEPVADRMPVYTPGPPFKLSAVSGCFLRRLQLLEEFNMLMPAMQRSDAVAGYFRSLAEGLPASDAPAGWWDIECDVGLLAGLNKHGFNCFEEIRRDTDFIAAFQGYHARYDQDAQAAADKAGSETHPQVQADHPQAAAAAGAADDSWPSDEVLSQRVRQLFTLLAQAVVLAESQGLLMPLPGEGLALTERLLQLPPSAGYVAAGASFFHESLWQEDEDAPLEDLLCADDGSDSSDSDQDAHGYAAYGRGRGRGRRGRGRGRGRGRTSKAERLAAEAAAFGAMVMPADKAAAAAAEDEGDEGGFGRRRVHRPNSRYADHVLIPVVAHEGGHQHGGGGAAYHAGGSSHQSEVKGGDARKKQRKDLLALLFTWGPPVSTATTEDGAAAAAAAADELPGEDDPAAAAAAEVYDWEGWGGRSEMTPSLQDATDTELTTLLKELTSEMDALIAAGSGAKPRNAHAPTCDCVVCQNRRRAEERRRQQEAAGAGEDGGDAAAAAAVDGGGVDEALQQEEEAVAAAAGGPESKQHVKAETLTASTAPRLQERIDMLATFRAASQTLARTWHTQAKSTAAAKELPPWWTSAHDGALVEGVVRHGYGNWTAMCEDESLPFKTAASHFGYDVDSAAAAAAAAAAAPVVKGAKGGKAAAAQPEWMPDPKALQKRIKSLVSILKRLLSRHAAIQSAPPSAGKGGTTTPPSAAAAASAGGGGTVAAQQQQQQMRLPPPNQAAAAQLAQLVQRLGTGAALLQALQAAAAQGNPHLMAEYLRQQQVTQQAILRQQQQQQHSIASVPGKRGAAAAGLPDGGAGRSVYPPNGSAAAALTAAAATGGGFGGLSPEGVATFVRSLPLVQRDASGAAVLPLVLSRDLLVIALGRVQPAHPAFHTARFIFPVGYTATCTYPSSVAAGGTTRYTTTIAEGAGGAALFVVVAADAPGKQWVATTAVGVWQQVCAQVQNLQQPQGVVVPAVDGVTQMGLTHPLVSMLIQELPNASACQQFNPELSPATPHVAMAIKQHQAAVHAAQQQQQQQARVAGAVAPPAAVVATAAAAAGVAPGGSATGAALQQQLMAAQLMRQQQQIAQAGQQPAAAAAAPAAAATNAQQQLLMQQLVQQRQQQMERGQPGLGVAGAGGSGAAAVVQQQLLLQQQLRARMSALQQQQQQQQQGQQ